MMSTSASKSVLITNNGGRITVEYDDAQSDEVLDELIRTMETGENWSVADYSGTRAIFRGNQIALLNMSQIIGFGFDNE